MPGLRLSLIFFALGRFSFEKLTNVHTEWDTVLTAELQASCRHRVYSKPSAATVHTFSQQKHLLTVLDTLHNLHSFLYRITCISLVRKIFKYYIKDMLKFKCPNSPPKEKGNTHAECQLFAKVCVHYTKLLHVSAIYFCLYRELHVCSTCTAYVANYHRRLADCLHIHTTIREYSDYSHYTNRQYTHTHTHTHTHIYIYIYIYRHTKVYPKVPGKCS